MASMMGLEHGLKIIITKIILMQALRKELAKNATCLVSLMIFTGSFLSFSMEPIVGRLLTPLYGGSSQVWLLSIMIFQGLMLLGYLYSHLINNKPGLYHIVILATPLIFQWPLNLHATTSTTSPTTEILLTLLKNISLLFFLLSTTAVVAQNWWRNSRLTGSNKEPYFLYSTSNLGSLAALLLYPFVIEPLTSLTTQRLTWSYVYIIYIALALMSWIALDPQDHSATNTTINGLRPKHSLTTRWVLLSMASSSLLFAATNLLSMEIGSIPLIWTPPLAAYLISFIITFNGKASRFNTRLEFWLPEIAATAIVLTIYPGTLPLVIIPVFFLFVIANKRLYELRPDPINLSYFYLCIAFGGWLGGVAVSIVAPMLFAGITEYPISILAITILCVQRNHLIWWSKASRLQGYPRFLALIASCLALTLFYWLATGGHSIRNFYGTYRIRDTIADVKTESFRSLIHGRTIHGRQYLAEGRRKEALAYYYTGGGLEQAMGLRRDGSPVAMIGLGAGGAIPWFKKGDDVSIMELDPDIEKLARNYFTYLNDTQATVKVVIGDARLTLAKETLEHKDTYDALLIDAFSGDGIPTHLLTLEALDIYLSRIPNDGLLIFHITNRFFDLKPVLLALAKERGLQAVFRTPNKTISNSIQTDPSVIVMAHQPNRLQSLLTDPRWRPLDTREGIESLTAWTDDQINVLAPLFLKLRTKWLD